MRLVWGFLGARAGCGVARVAAGAADGDGERKEVAPIGDCGMLWLVMRVVCFCIFVIDCVVGDFCWF